jgi:hypothetical protein
VPICTIICDGYFCSFVLFSYNENFFNLKFEWIIQWTAYSITQMQKSSNLCYQFFLLYNFVKCFKTNCSYHVILLLHTSVLLSKNTDIFLQITAPLWWILFHFAGGFFVLFCFGFFCLFCYCWVRTQGFKLKRQVLYHLNLTASPFCWLFLR